ncbi:MAG: SpoIIE family protein phosphatase [bacterium]|nr:SpoIIE family protein phosphatase [bacterium]
MTTLQTTTGRKAWRWILASLALLLLAAVTGGIYGADQSDQLPAVFCFVFLTASWAIVVAFVMLDTWGRWFWLALVLGAGALAGWAGTGGVIGAVTMTAAMMVVRTLHTWRHVSARRRAVGFGLGIVALVMLVLASGFRAGEELTGIMAGLRDLGTWALGSLFAFWIWSLFNLAVRMRLHFLRLRPKLTIAAILIGFVPLLVLSLLGALTLYGGLGGARAARASRVLETWRETAIAGVDLAPAVFDTVFTWPATAPARDDCTVLPAPAWPAAVAPHLASSDTAVTDSTTWFLAEGDVWLVRWRRLGTPEVTAEGWLLGEKPLLRLSGMLRAGVVLRFLGHDGEGFTIGENDRPSVPRYHARRVVYRDVSADPGFWDDWRVFGSSLLRVLQPSDDRLMESGGFINLKVGWTDLWDEFVGGENNLNVVVVVVFGLAVFLFLVVESFALFFGVRISEGIVAAVHHLDRGTRAVAAGDLDTTIDLPNEDEFGDLAGSFNEMTRTVRQGREDALARERLTRELETARAIQERLLPDAPPTLAGFEVAGASIPSREIGGDYFDFLLQDDGRIGLAIADVSGKGMPAALLMANLQASLHGQVIHPSSVSGVVKRVNDLLVASTDPHMFATFFYGVLDTTEATLTCTNAGHNPPLVLRENGDFAELQKGGLLLGMLQGQDYGQEKITLAPGEIVVLFTDGITEAVGPSVEENDPEAMFGEDALMSVVRRHAHLPAVGIKEAILTAVAEHTEGVEQSDDITLVVVRRQG